MTVRGAGAIGGTAGYAMAQAFLEALDPKDETEMRRAKEAIESTRPTAQNLFFATNRVYRAAIHADDPKETAVKEAQKIADEDAENCRKIGEIGASLISEGMRIETHCNAGWLAFVDFGSALSPIYVAKRQGKNPFVFVDETRPRSQGARLTAWELKNENIPHAIIPDNAGAHYMSQNEIDMIIVGCDRIARNGDVANKIGTLEKAIAAKAFDIPFYFAAPSTTIDFSCASGKDIPIEMRGEEEVIFQSGLDEHDQLHKIRVASPGSSALNPAFDVTPARCITGIITERGIIKPSEEEIAKLAPVQPEND